MIHEIKILGGSIEVKPKEIESTQHPNSPVRYYSQEVEVVITLEESHHRRWMLEASYFRHWDNYSDLVDETMDTLICLEGLLRNPKESLKLLVEQQDQHKITVNAAWLPNFDWRTISHEELVSHGTFDGVCYPHP